jgi:hypothetical protein
MRALIIIQEITGRSLVWENLPHVISMSIPLEEKVMNQRGGSEAVQEEILK